ncbi:MAG TPA: hypothetical protein VFP89_03805 [Propionibacteriaceae bacterium]|nr:hypothetical protein [Propionibacteriaceae bacterium]
MGRLRVCRLPLSWLSLSWLSLSWVLVCCLVLPGCSYDVLPAGDPVDGTSTRTVSPDPLPSRAPREPRQLTVQRTLDQLTSAVRTADQPAFRALVAGADPEFATTATMLWGNLTQLPLTRFELAAGARTASLSPTRRALLGDEAWVQQVRVRWQLAAEPYPAAHWIWMTFSGGSRPLLAGTADAPSGESTEARPLWWLEPVTVARSADSVALVAAKSTARRWALRGHTAVQAVAGRVGGHAGSRSNPQLTLEVPSSQAMFERVLGVAGGSYRAVAATAWPEGPDTETAALRVVVNPDAVNGVGEEGLAILLAHEATHVLTRSPGSAAPTWLVEGFADYVAYEAYPATRATAAAALLDRVRRHGPPPGLPRDGVFIPASDELDRAYAGAWLACRLVAELGSPPTVTSLYQRVSAGAPLDVALTSLLGMDEKQFTRRWQRYLVTLSRRG